MRSDQTSAPPCQVILLLCNSASYFGAWKYEQLSTVSEFIQVLHCQKQRMS